MQKRLKHLAVIIIILPFFSIPSVPAAESIVAPMLEGEQPKEYYLRTQVVDEDEELLVFRADIDRNGSDEMFIAAQTSAKDGHGHNWKAFVQVDEEWQLAQVGVEHDDTPRDTIIFEGRIATMIELEILGGWALTSFGKGKPPFLTVITKTSPTTLQVEHISSEDDPAIAIIAYGLAWEHTYGDVRRGEVTLESLREDDH